MAGQDKSVFQTLRELKDLTVAYARQETWEPLKQVGDFLKYGVPGALCSALGLFLLSLALLRGLQTKTGNHLRGDWNVVPYIAALFGLAVLCGLFARAITRKGNS